MARITDSFTDRKIAAADDQYKALRAEARELAAREYLVATNQGTYSAQEACRKIGTGDPRHADRDVFETVGGGSRVTGPAEGSDLPGYMRGVSTDNLKADRKRLAEIRKAIGNLLKEWPELAE